MRFSDIISLGMDWLIYALLLAIICGAAFFIGYRLIYKKLCKGTKTLPLPRFLLYAMFFCYIIVVLGVTLLERQGYVTMGFRLTPFYSYIEAWNQYKDADWRNIILNIFMLVPFGLLLPYIAKPFRRFIPTAAAGMVFTLFIEMAQLLLKRGIFETDDLINNTMGVLIGYGFYRLADYIYNRIKKEKTKLTSVLLCQIPLFITVIAFSSIFATHYFKELGNLNCRYIIKGHPQSVTCNATFDENSGKAYVYIVPVVSVEETEAYAREFFARFDAGIDESRTDIYDETAIYYNDDNSLSLWIDYEGNKIDYTNFTSHYDEEGAGPKTNATEEEIRLAAEELGFFLPKEAEYINEENGNYRFECNCIVVDDYVYDGNAIVRYNENNLICDLDYNIIKCSPYKEFPIISEEEAYNLIAEGKYRFEPAFEPANIVINDIYLSYEVDSKGFYQPIYIFECNVDGEDTRMYTPAIP